MNLPPTTSSSGPQRAGEETQRRIVGGILAEERRRRQLLGGTAVLVLATGLVSIMVGAYLIPIADVLAVLAAKAGLRPADTLNTAVVWDMRLTRVLLAGAVGAALATSGAAYQGTFRNPLVEPFILGVSAGAAFGAGLAVMVDLPLSMQVLAFVFGTVAVGLTYTLSRVRGERPTVTLVLSGVVVGSFFSAVFSLFQYVGTDEQLRRLVFWIMGGFYRATWSDVVVVVPASILGIGLLWRRGWRLNILSLGDDEARSLGCDDLARTISTGEIPIGIITSILGAPYLVYLLRTRAARTGAS